jgi:ribosomal protein S18 acetylase RimI-like enzyme
LNHKVLDNQHPMLIELNNRAHLDDFIRLNEAWITEHFSLEAADHELARNPGGVIDSGGSLLTLTAVGQVLGVCALFPDEPGRVQLARMAVAPEGRGMGYGQALLAGAKARAKETGATSIILYSNTKLVPAIALYRKHGFVTISTGSHPKYARCNIVMVCALG